VSGVAPRPLSRTAARGQSAAPVRILHLGLGNFFRAHQAWYTHHAADAAEWGIAAFTGRRPGLARTLAAQDGLYTLVVRGAEGDRHEVIRSLSAAHPGADHASWLDYWRLPGLCVVTLTITEAGYARVQGTDGDGRNRRGSLDTARADVSADIAALKASSEANVTTAPAKLLAGLAARREAGLPPVVIVPCDNLPGNAEVARRVVRDLAEAVGHPTLRRPRAIWPCRRLSSPPIRTNCCTAGLTRESGTPSRRSRPTVHRSSPSASSRPCAQSALRAACRTGRRTSCPAGCSTCAVAAPRCRTPARTARWPRGRCRRRPAGCSPSSTRR